MANAVLKLRRRLEAIVFINHLIIAAGCARTPCALEAWGIAFEEAHLGKAFDEPTHKWSRYLKGVMVQPALRVALSKRFSVLLVVLCNPLWEVLRLVEREPKKAAQLADQLLINGEPLRYNALRRFEQQRALPHWSSLCILVAILANNHPHQHYEHRLWVRSHFTLQVYLMCLQPEMVGCAKLLYRLLDAYFRAGHLPPVDGWPPSLQAFKRETRKLRRLSAFIHKRHPRLGTDVRAVIFTLYSDPLCRLGLKRGLDQVWNRCRRIAVSSSHAALETVVSFRELPYSANALRGWPLVASG